MVYEELFQRFAAAVPESADYCKAKAEEAGVDDTDGMHCYFAFAVRPYVQHIMKTGDRNALKKAANFFECMEMDGDRRIPEVLEQSVMEHLMAENRDLVAKYDDIWGPETKEAFAAVEKWVL